METKKIVGVITVAGGDALVYDSGEIVALVQVEGVNGVYYVKVPVDLNLNLKPEDAGNADYAELPGYQAPIPAPGGATTNGGPNPASSNTATQ